MTTEELIREWKHTLTRVANEMTAVAADPHSEGLSDVLFAVAHIRRAVDFLR